jgi:hypothetical protein
MQTDPALTGLSPQVPINLPKNLFRFGEITLYSTHGFGSTAAGGANIANTTNRMFVTQLGGTGQGFAQGLSVSETNLKEAGRIPSGQAYDVFGVATQVLAWNPSDGAGTIVAPITSAALANSGLATAVNNGVLSWDFTQTKVFICPMILAGAGGGIFGAVADSAGNQIGALNNGNGGIWMYRKHPVALPGSSTFAVELQFGTRAGTLPQNVGLAIRVVLLGYYKSIIEIG